MGRAEKPDLGSFCVARTVRRVTWHAVRHHISYLRRKKERGGRGNGEEYKARKRKVCIWLTACWRNSFVIFTILQLILVTTVLWNMFSRGLLFIAVLCNAKSYINNRLQTRLCSASVVPCMLSSRQNCKIVPNSQQLTPLQKQHLQTLYMTRLMALYHQLLTSFCSTNTSEDVWVRGG